MSQSRVTKERVIDGPSIAIRGTLKVDGQTIGPKRHRLAGPRFSDIPSRDGQNHPAMGSPPRNRNADPPNKLPDRESS